MSKGLVEEKPGMEHVLSMTIDTAVEVLGVYGWFHGMVHRLGCGRRGNRSWGRNFA